MIMIKNELYKYQDLKYQEFISKLLLNVNNIIGIRIPILRKLSKKYKLEDLTDDTFEEIMLQGFIIGNDKDINKVLNNLKIFIPKINNWSVCDSVVSSLKITKKNQEIMFNFIIKYVNGSEFEKRFLLVMVLNYYLDDNYINKVIDIISNIKITDYYDMMALSWLISKMYINYKDEVIEILQNKNISDEVVNKSISKINDSYQIKKEDKSILIDYRR